MDRIKSRIKGVFGFFWRYKLRSVCVLLALFIALSGVHYYKSGKAGNATVSFNYSEASQGLNPNKTRFSFSEIISDEVLERGIWLAGLEDCITPARLSAHIGISPVDTGNAGGDDEYISTTYRVSLSVDGLEMKNRTAADLLKNICGAYREYFLENHCDNQEILRLRLEETTGSEPFLRMNELKQRVRQIEKYMSARMSENRTFSDDDSGLSFDELDKRLQNIIDYDIPNATAYIIECGVASNEAELTRILEYKNKIEAVSEDKQRAYYTADNDGISAYEELMSAAVMIPTLDTQEQYYMSRTKTAMDAMARSADAALSEATEHRDEIVGTEYVIEKLAQNETAPEQLTTARSMINKLERALNDLAEDALMLDSAYIDYKSQDYVTFNYSSPSLIQRIGLKKTAVEVAVFCVGAAIVAYAVLGRKKKERKDR